MQGQNDRDIRGRKGDGRASRALRPGWRGSYPPTVSRRCAARRAWQRVQRMHFPLSYSRIHGPVRYYDNASLSMRRIDLSSYCCCSSPLATLLRSLPPHDSYNARRYNNARGTLACAFAGVSFCMCAREIATVAVALSRLRGPLSRVERGKMGRSDKRRTET